KRRADRRKTDAEEASRKESAQRRRAEETLKLGFQALEEIYLEEAEERLPRAGPAGSPDRRLLEKALRFYQAFLDKNRGRPSARLEVGKALFRIARLHDELGHFSEARRAYGQALTLFKDLAATDPKDPGNWIAQVRIHRSLGGLYRGRDAEAGAAEYQKALEA